MTKLSYKNLCEATRDFSSIERVASSIFVYISVNIPGEENPTLAADIISSGVNEFLNTQGDFSHKYTAFLFGVIRKLPNVTQYSVSNCNSATDQSIGTYWDSIGESYHSWAERTATTNPIIEKMDVQEGWLGGNEDGVAILIAGKIFDRSDLSFLGIPHPGKSTLFGNSSPLDLITIAI